MALPSEKARVFVEGSRLRRWCGGSVGECCGEVSRHHSGHHHKPLLKGFSHEATSQKISPRSPILRGRAF